VTDAIVRAWGAAVLVLGLTAADLGAQLPTDLGGPPSWSSSISGGSFVRRRGGTGRADVASPAEAPFAERTARAVNALATGAVTDPGGGVIATGDQALVADVLIGSAGAAPAALGRALGAGSAASSLASTLTGLAGNPAGPRVLAAVEAWNAYAASLPPGARRAPGPTAVAVHAALATIVDDPRGDAVARGFAIRVPATAPRERAPRPRAQPGWSGGSPVAYGAAQGEYFVGVGYQGAVRNSDEQDGSVAVGIGLGNPVQFVGFELAAASLSTVRGGFGNRNTASFKLHRVLSGAWAVSVGAEHAFAFGTDARQNDGSRSIYGVVSNVVEPAGRAGRPFDAFGFSFGAGSGRFKASNPADSPTSGVAPFGIVAARVVPWASLIADYGGEDLTLALSLAPLARIPVVITPMLADVLTQVNAAPRFVMAVGMGFRVGGYRF
jgi:hypothetical protein